MEQKGYEIKSRFNVTAQFEISVDSNGWNFCLIYGKHANGGFCAIPGWRLGFEMGTPEEVEYNAIKIRRAAINWKEGAEKRAIFDAALDLAIAIREFAKQLKENRAMPIEKTVTEEIEEQLRAEGVTDEEVKL